MATSAPASADAVNLNPFVVSENERVGYAASRTLAGPRINTALRDVGAAIRNHHTPFSPDTAATNLGELLTLTTATAVGGVSGNFAGGSVAPGRPDQSESRENPQANHRLRGIGAATTTRDTFITDIPFDAYNSSGDTNRRGPNPRAAENDRRAVAHPRHPARPRRRLTTSSQNLKSLRQAHERGSAV
jgi:hypothetical protein